MAWLDGWAADQRVEITIDSTLIGATLTDFPVMLNLSASSGLSAYDLSAIFDELTSDANRTKIAVTTSDGETQCYVEIEHWDDANEVAALHVKVPYISSSANTILYLYYDSSHAANTTYVGDVGSTPAQSVWDSDFMGVWHFANDPNGDVASSIKDSTDNVLHGTPYGTMLTEDLVEGLSGGKGIEFDGTDDRIELDATIMSSAITAVTVDMVWKAAAADTTIDPIVSFAEAGEFHYTLRVNESVADVVRLYLSMSPTALDQSDAITDVTAHNHYSMRATEGGDGSLYVNDVIVGSEQTSLGTFLQQTPSRHIIATDRDLSTYSDGIASEYRFSKIARSDAWQTATYHTLFDTLISFKSEPEWLSGWAADQRVKITIDSSKIDAALTNFPVMLNLSTSSGLSPYDLSAIFDELASDANRTKIAVTTADGETECYVEIEHWDDANEVAALHVKVPYIASFADTILYLYYDSGHAANTTYVGDTGDAAAQSVWDSDFEHVYHLNQDPDGDAASAIKDSTASADHMTPTGTMTTADLVAASTGARGIDFDGSDDGLETLAGWDIDAGVAEITLEAMFKPGTVPSDTTMDHLITAENTIGGSTGASLRLTESKIEAMVYAGAVYQTQSSGTVSTATEYFGALRYANPGSLDVFLNDTKTSAGSISANVTRGDGTWNVGNWIDVATREFDGVISEVRIASTERSDAWLKATYYTLFDTLVSFDVEAPWLGTWANRRRFNISSSLVDGALSDFPVTLIINSSCGLGTDDLTDIFDELTSDANRTKIAVTTADGETQCYVEIEHWDDASEKAVLHVKVPALSASLETHLYFYYDSAQSANTTYVGDTGSTPGETVWDSDFVAVYHMATDPSGASAFKDSTSNSLDGSMVGTMLTEDLIDGNIGKAINFDGSNDEFTRADTSLLDLNGSEDLTIEAVFRHGATGSMDTIFDKRYGTGAYQGWLFGIHSDNALHFYAKDTGQDTIEAVGNTTIDAVAWNYGGGRFDKTGDDDLDIWLNDAVDVASPDSLSAIGDLGNTNSAHFAGNSCTSSWAEFEGDIQEIRISKTYRSDAWMKATYYCLFDTLGTWGDAEEREVSDGAVNVTAGTPADIAYLAKPVTVAIDIFAAAGTPANITYTALQATVGNDVIVEMGTPPDITFSTSPATISVTIPAGTPANVTWAALNVLAGIGVDVTTPNISWEALAATVEQNLDAIGIMTKPTVTSTKPTITATGAKPRITATTEGD